MGVVCNVLETGESLVAWSETGLEGFPAAWALLDASGGVTGAL